MSSDHIKLEISPDQHSTDVPEGNDMLATIELDGNTLRIDGANGYPYVTVVELTDLQLAALRGTPIPTT